MKNFFKSFSYYVALGLNMAVFNIVYYLFKTKDLSIDGFFHYGVETLVTAFVAIVFVFFLFRLIQYVAAPTGTAKKINSFFYGVPYLINFALDFGVLALACVWVTVKLGGYSINPVSVSAVLYVLLCVVFCRAHFLLKAKKEMKSKNNQGA